MGKFGEDVHAVVGVFKDPGPATTGQIRHRAAVSAWRGQVPRIPQGFL